jgi:hypothetical protein
MRYSGLPLRKLQEALVLESGQIAGQVIHLEVALYLHHHPAL